MPVTSENLTGLTDLLCCPVTGQKLHIATQKELHQLLAQDANNFLVREDGTAAYPVRGGIPSLLPESLIPFSL
ncbi:MAG: hypothetical protein WCP60_09665 [bacterium]